MKRIKVVNEPTELVPMLRALDTKVKREVFKEVANEWVTSETIEEKYGEEGKNALIFFERMRLVETMWQTTKDNRQVKVFHTYYMSFHINTSCPVMEISDVLAVAVMPNDEFDEFERKIVEMIGDEGMFAGDMIENMGISAIMLKSLVKRSTKFDYKGHRVEKIKNE